MIRVESNINIPKDQLARAFISIERIFHQRESGFLQLPERDPVWQSSIAISKSLREKFTDLVVMGVGGSSLGALVFKDIFSYKSKTHRLHFMDNVDPYLIDKLMTELPDMSKVAFLVVSKSGSTMETLALMDLCCGHFKKIGREFSQHCVVVSEPVVNPLTTWARLNKVQQAEIPVDVGGRYSVLSACGLIPAGFLGLDLNEVRAGARWATEQKELCAQLIAHSMASFQREEWITVAWMYSSLLSSLGGWWRQLWSESLAKKSTTDGKAPGRVSTPMVAVGSNDQHSILQQVMEGAKDKWVVFFRVKAVEEAGDVLKESQFPTMSFWSTRTLGQVLAAEAIATQQGLQQNKVSTMTFEMENLSPKSVAAYFMIWEIVVAALGIHLNINPFDQPGVELGKRLAKDILKG